MCLTFSDNVSAVVLGPTEVNVSWPSSQLSEVEDDLNGTKYINYPNTDVILLLRYVGPQLPLIFVMCWPCFCLLYCGCC